MIISNHLAMLKVEGPLLYFFAIVIGVSSESPPKSYQVAEALLESIADVKNRSDWTFEAAHHLVKPQATVILFGQTARPACTTKARVLDAVKTQRRFLFGPLISRGFDVVVLLATNPCDDGWEETLKHAYGPHLRSIVSDACAQEPKHRCLINVSYKKKHA